MKILQTELPGLLIIEPDVFRDERGYFCETYNQQKLSQLGFNQTFVQDNESMSSKGVLRGIHFQKPPFAQAKLVRVVRGSIIDFAVDLRKGSPTYGKYKAVELDSETKRMLYLPEGFGHAFVSLEDNTIFSYKCSNFYNKESESGILWSDEDLNIDWKIDNPILSDKDKILGKLKDFDSPFTFEE
ncbi:MAG: dTDP-4-dehydrorhamnose 3,5-epimerase [Bacteroidales bacterium]|jgi:dTDP-4-dehydrorhamnose 3,5-epimerase|nr:dTDP-4-dehydrorhamnose 3,5-epimerase [Bacteroidales bacterium]